MAKCVGEGYICTQKFFFEQASSKPTPLFDQLIDSIDLTDKNYVSQLPTAIKNVLQAEMISTEQLEMLARLLEQVQNETKDTQGVKQLLNEVTYIQNTLVSAKNADLNQEKFVIFFKKAFTISDFNKIKKSYLHLPSVEIAYNTLPNTSENLITGICENAHLNEQMQVTSWKVMSEKTCSWSESFGKSTAGFTSTIKENKGWIITGAVLIGAAILVNQYEVKFQF